MNRYHGRPTIRLGFAGALLLCIAATPAVAGSIKLADGTRLSGVTSGYDAEARALRVRTDAGRELWVPLEALDGREVYGIKRRQVPEDDGPGQLGVAHYARDIGLYAHAMRHYDRALDADPSLLSAVVRGRSELQALETEESLDRAHDALMSNDRPEARKWLARIVERHPGTAAAKHARGLLDELEGRTRTPNESGSLDDVGTTLHELDLGRGGVYFERLLTKNREGRKETRSSGRAIRLWESAISDGERALRELARLEEKHEGTPEAAMMRHIAGRTRAEIVDVRLNLASLYAVRQSYGQALAEANEALAVLPHHPGARAMRARVEEAAGQSILLWPAPAWTELRGP